MLKTFTELTYSMPHVMKTSCIRRRLPRSLAAAFALVAVVAGVEAPRPVAADQVPNPTVTSSATPFNSTYSANNLFDTSYSSEYASQGKVACSAPLVNDGTYVEMDFGSTVTFDRFILVGMFDWQIEEDAKLARRVVSVVTGPGSKRTRPWFS